MKDLILPFLVISFIFISASTAITFVLQPNSKRCLGEEVQKNILVTGDYHVQEAKDPNQRIHLTVTDTTNSHVLLNRENIDKGKFAFNSDAKELIQVCFSSSTTALNSAPQEIMINLRHGVEAKTYESLANASKLKPMEVELKRLEDLTESIVKDFIVMREEEESMRDTNESTNNRVFYFSILSMLCLLGLATWQVLYLRQFFQAKKLIS